MTIVFIAGEPGAATHRVGDERSKGDPGSRSGGVRERIHIQMLPCIEWCGIPWYPGRFTVGRQKPSDFRAKRRLCPARTHEGTGFLRLLRSTLSPLNVDHLRDERAVKVRLRGSRGRVIQKVPPLHLIPPIDHIVAATTVSGRIRNDRSDVITSSSEGDLQAASNYGPVSQGPRRGVLAPNVENEEGG